MPFTPRYSQPNPSDPYYSTYNRFQWLFISNQYGGNCTGYAYGRTNEIAGRSLYDEFRITASPGNGNQWIYNTWPEYTHTSGPINIQAGDILVWGGGTYGHVEVVESVSGSTLITSYSVYGSTYAESQVFANRTIQVPTWGSHMGTWIDNNGDSHYYTNPFIGYIHNPYADSPTPPPTPTTTLDIEIIPGSYTKTMSGSENFLDFAYSIRISGIPAGETVSGGNTFPGMYRVSNTGWSYSDYTVGGVTYRYATKQQTLRYDREHSYAYTTTKHMYFNITKSTGTIATDTPMYITVQPKIMTRILAALKAKRKRGLISVK